METEQINNEQLPLPTPESTFKYFPFFNQQQPIFVLILVGIIFYCTSLYNEYALDDAIIIHQNSYVLKGITGVKDILTKDAYASFYSRMNATDQLQGGRYRPLASVSYAIEQEIIGTYRTGYYMFAQDLNNNGVLDKQKVVHGISTSKIKGGGKTKVSDLPDYEYNQFTDVNGDKIAQENECNNCWDLNKNFRDDLNEDLNQDGVFNEVDCQVKGAFLRHFNNVWLYILACIFLYLVFSKYLFKTNHDIAFLAALIFLIHPVHSEIVANVKGREDIFSLLFIALTFLFSFKYLETKKWQVLIFAGISFLLALLSKEYAIMLLFLIPIAIYVFEKDKIDTSKLTLLMTTLFAFFSIYLSLRLISIGYAPGSTDTELLNNPYLLASGEEKFASKVFVLIKYLGIAIFPYKLTSDYSYAEIAYSHFTDISFFTSLVLNVGLLILGIILVFKRHVLGFAIITYYAFLLLVTNFIFDVGVVMREGFLFHASIGVAIALAWLSIKGLQRIKTSLFISHRSLILSALTLIVFLCACKTWERNWDWKNDVTLFLKDVKTSPNSVLVLGNAGARWIDLADTKEITGVALMGEDSTIFNDYNGKLKITDEEMVRGGYKTKREAALNKGIDYLKRAVQLHPRYVNGFLNLGLASFKLDNDRDAIFYWKLAENLYPNNPYLKNYYHVYSNILKDRGDKAFSESRMQDAAEAYNFLTIVNPDNPAAWYNLGTIYNQLKMYNKAKFCWQKTLKLDQNYKDIKKLLNELP